MIETQSYRPTDPFFGAPYIDLDEVRTTPMEHRFIHGGFAGTDTRFAFYFPLGGQYEGRMFQPIEGGHGGHEESFGSPMLEAIIGGLAMCTRLGGYMAESNQGHIGDNIDPKGGDDPTFYGHRGSAESARFSKHVATQVYGEAPHHSYVWGGSGGGRRSPLCLENAPDAWDGAMPFMGGGEIAEHGNHARIKGAQVMSFASMFNVQRLLGDRLASVVDAMSPGGSGDPFTGLTTHEREELASLYRQGFPRGDEFMINEPMGQIWLWSSIADDLNEQDRAYFENFWTKPGYIGHDHPELVTNDIIDVTLPVKRVITAAELLGDEFAGPEYMTMRTLVGVMAGSSGTLDQPYAVEVEGLDKGYRLGAGVKIASGDVAGRQMYCNSFAGNVMFCDGHGEANLQRFTGVKAGDLVNVDNRRFLAFCYFARHHPMDDMQFDSFRVDGSAIYPLHEAPLMSPLMGQAYSGQYEGKLIWLHHTHDSSLWPPQGIIYEQAVLGARGPKGAAEHFRLRWTQNAEHGPAMMVPSKPGRASNTWLINFRGILEQSLRDLVAWVEDGVAPAGTSYEYLDGKVTLPPTAAARGGIQPVVHARANGGVRAEVAAGETVSFSADAAVPPGAGRIVAVDWDFDGSGTYPMHHELDGTLGEGTFSTTHAYAEAGTFFATARVTSHRHGDVTASNCLVENLDRVRVVVK